MGHPRAPGRDRGREGARDARGRAELRAKRSPPTGWTTSQRSAWRASELSPRVGGAHERVGFWLDIDHAYVTFSRSYVQSVWWALKSSSIAACCTGAEDRVVVARGGTALCAGEIGEGYRDVDDPSITTKFRVKGRENTFFLDGRRRPGRSVQHRARGRTRWDYAFFRGPEGETLVHRGGAASRGRRGDRAEKGTALVGWEYEPLYPYTDRSVRATKVAATSSSPGRTCSSRTGRGSSTPRPPRRGRLRGAEEGGARLIQLVGPDGRSRTRRRNGFAGGSSRKRTRTSSRT